MKEIGTMQRMIGLALLAAAQVAGLAACGQGDDSSDDVPPTTMAVTAPPATQTAPATAAPVTPIAEIRLSSGGGYNIRQDGLVDIWLMRDVESLLRADAVTFAAAEGVCPGGVQEYVIRDRGGPEYVFRDAGGEVNVTADDDTPVTWKAICGTAGDGELELFARCHGGNEMRLGTMHCYDPTVLYDPKGHINEPKKVHVPPTPCGLTANPEAYSAALFVVATMTPGTSDCPVNTPPVDWSVRPTAVTGQGTLITDSSVPSRSEIVPGTNPLTNLVPSAEFAWDSPDGCYFVQITGPDPSAHGTPTTWTSPVVGVQTIGGARVPVDNLHFTLPAAAVTPTPGIWKDCP